MPASPPPPSQDQIYFDALSDDDFEVLYQIVQAAQQSPTAETLPFRALFKAYDEVLLRYGLDSDHDQVYIRFLFRLGNRKQPGVSLEETFEAFLAEHDVRLEFDSAQEGHEAEEKPEDTLGTVGESTRGTENEIFAPRGRARRASFSSVINAEEEHTKQFRRRDESRASLSRVEFAEKTPLRKKTRSNHNAGQAQGRPLQEVLPSGNISPSPSQRSGRMRRHSPQAQDQPSHRHENHHVSRVQPRERNRELWESSDRAGPPQSLSNYDLSAASEDDAPNERENLNQVKRRVNQPSPLYRPSDTQIAREVEVFESFRHRALARQVIQLWRDSTERIMNYHQYLDDLATSRDQETLARQAFEIWRSLYLSRKQVAETERFFSTLEIRAERARNVYLLIKAFTHWAQCASEEVDKNRLAARHVLRLRYFNAWKEITAVNEMKVRRQGLRKFFGIWKRRFDEVLDFEARAIDIYRGNLAETIYWRWFWGFCDRRAPEWRAGRSRKQLFQRWQTKTTELQELLKEAVEARQIFAQRRCVSIWMEKTRIFRSCESQIVQMKHQKLLVTALAQWRIKVRHAPLEMRISSMVDWRIAYTSFSKLRKVSALERQSTAVDRLRILGNAWTAWNDTLRMQAVSAQIDERVILQALYKWVLAERYRLMDRLHQKRINQRYLLSIYDRWKSKATIRENSLHIVAHSQKYRLLSDTMQCWTSHFDYMQQQEKRSFDFYAPQAAQGIMQKWGQRAEHVQKLERWSSEAAFYFRAYRTLKRLQAAVEESQRQKRHNAYAQMRRKVKMSLARRALLHWRGKTEHKSELERRSEQMQQDKLQRIAADLFNHWLQRTGSILSESASFDIQYSTHLARQTFSAWSQKLDTQTLRNKRAVVFAGLHVEKSAYDVLRAFHIKALDLRAKKDMAASFWQYNEGRRIRALIYRWRDKTVQNRAQGRSEFGAAYTSRRGPGAFTSTALFDDDVASTVEEDLPPQQPLRTMRYGQTAFVPRRPTTSFAADTRSNLDSVRPEVFISSRTPRPDFELEDWMFSTNTNPGAVASGTVSAPPPTYLSTPSKRAERAGALVRIGSTTPVTPLGGIRRPDYLRAATTGATRGRSTIVGGGEGGGSGVDMRRGLLGRSILREDLAEERRT
ncbi:hypothetical protein MMC25_007412 [Agyrium rufum]|nr:hypothetical protein [Agyrium rufum]